MTDRSRPDQPPRSGLYRSLPCQNIATADDDSWQSSCDKSNDRRLMSPTKEEKSRTNSAVKKIMRSPDTENMSYGFQEEASVFSDTMTYGAGSPSVPAYGRRAAETAERAHPGRDQPDRVQPESDLSDTVQSGRGVVTSKSTPSFANYKIDRIMQIMDENDGAYRHNIQTGSSSNPDSPTVSNGTLTPGPLRRSAIPVRSHRRSSSASADDESSSLNFMLHMANGKSTDKNALTPLFTQMLQNTTNKSTPRQKNELSGINSSSKQLSILTSRRLLEGATNKAANDGLNASLNLRHKYQLNKATPLKMAGGTCDSLQKPLLTVTPTLSRQSSITSNAASERSASRIPHGTASSAMPGRIASRIPTNSMSQPGSRSASPSGKLALLTYRQPDATKTPLSRPTSARTRTELLSTSQLQPSRIPRSQGHSRDTSPSRSSDGSEKRSKISSSGRFLPANYDVIGVPQKMSLLSSKVLLTGTEMEQTLTDALAGSLSLRREDAASETSSVSSEFSQMQLNSTTSPMDIISMMSSASWSERRQGLFGLQQMMKSNGVLHPLELKKVTEIFTRMFHDPQAKVFNAFLETLVDVLEMHSEDMADWLYTCLSRLLVKLSADLLGSVQARIYKALRTICERFTFELQVAAIARFLTEHTQASNLRVRMAILDHVHEMTLMTEPSDFVGSESCKQLALCIVQWTNEPKSSDIRKAAQSTVVALFNLNTPEFSAVLSRLPRYIQDCARRILHNHMFAISQQVETQSGFETASVDGQLMNSTNETDQLSSEDYITSLKKTAEDIQNLSSLS